jgi:uncharacterized protein (DUF2267 family)
MIFLIQASEFKSSIENPEIDLFPQQPTILFFVISIAVCLCDNQQAGDQHQLNYFMTKNREEGIMVNHFENYVQEGNLFLKRLADELGSPGNQGHAFRVLNAVFKAIRDRITPQESLHLISEMPMAIKGLYVNDWKIHDKPKKYETKAQFLDEVCNSMLTTEIDFGSDAEDEVRAVFRVLKGCISEGELRHVKGQLTPEIAELMEV